MVSPLIIALDFDNQNKALELVEKLNPATCSLKIGSEMFTLYGPSFVKQLIKQNFKVFLDLKFHDIPNTVANACKAAADLGVWMMNVHASGGMQMMEAAYHAIQGFGSDRPLLIAVTVLTSFSDDALSSIGINHSSLTHVSQLALLAKNSGLDGVVSSAHEVKKIKEQCGSDFITVTPGIRLAHDCNDDQYRIMTPQLALSEGTDYLVIGRSITRSSNPSETILNILSDCQILK